MAPKLETVRNRVEEKWNKHNEMKNVFFHKQLYLLMKKTHNTQHSTLEQ